MKRSFPLLLCLLCTGASYQLHAQQAVGSTASTPAPQPFTHKKMGAAPGDFHFIIMADRTGSHREGIFEQAIHKVNLLQPDFVMSVGDLIEGYKTDETAVAREWEELDSVVNGLHSRFYYVAGNHDYSNKPMAAFWRKRLGDDYYSFRYKDCLFLCLNSEDSAGKAGKPAMGKAQFEYFQQQVSREKNIRWTFVFMHQPLWLYDSTGYWSQFEQLIATNKHTVFAGHIHRYTKYVRNNSQYIVMGTTGGVSWLKGKAFGEVDHITRVAMTNNGPVISNFLPEGIEPADFVTESSAAIFNSFANRPAVYLEPNYYSSLEQFKSVMLVIRNEQVFPLHVDLQAMVNKDYIPLLPSLAITVPAHTTQRIDIPVQHLHAYALDTASVLEFRASCKFKRPNAPDLAWEQLIKSKPLQRYHVPVAGHPVKVDGKLDEWELSYHVQDRSGQSPVRYAFDVSVDSVNGYVAVHVKDPDIYNPPKTAPIEMDGIIITLDGKDSSKSIFNVADVDAHLRGEWRYLGINPLADSGTLVYRNLIPAAFQGQYRRTADGYTAEISFPLSYLDQMQGRNWQYFRLNISVVDRRRGQQLIRIDWQPFWAENVPGTGLFYKH